MNRKPRPVSSPLQGRLGPESPRDSRSLSRLLVYGTAETRRSLAEGLAREDDGESWSLLAETVFSQDGWRLRARSLEVLGLAAAGADRDVAEAILNALLLAARP